jgi:16S rRNA (cytidine1402-2'-O)-methyltransferase
MDTEKTENTVQRPALLLLPNLLGEIRHHEPFFPTSVDKAVQTLNGLIAESEQGGRRFLSHFYSTKEAHEIPIALFNEHTPDTDLDFLLEPILRKGERWGLVADAGLPCVADPGAKLVQRARKIGVVVQAFIGPSAILLSLMLSGFNGQRFTFHGYLDKEPKKRQDQIKKLEKVAKGEQYTQIFIETPYRNQHTLEALVETLNDASWLCVAWDLTLPTQGVLSQPVATWKKSPLPNLAKRNAIFLIGTI